MDELGYEDLLSKCIQNGLQGGDYSKSTTEFQGKAEPAVGTGRLLENPTSGSKEDTSGAAEGPLAESDSGHRLATGMDGTALDKSMSPFIATTKSAGTGHMRGRALLSEDLKINGFPQSFLKSRGMGAKPPPPTFSFRSLLEGAISASEAKPSTRVHRMAELDMRGAPNVEPQIDCVSGEKHPLSDERRVVGKRRDGVVSSNSTSQCRRDEKVLSGEGLAESRQGEGNLALRARDSGDSVADSRPHISYSSLLQAQLGDDVDKVRTETPPKTAEALFVYVEAHSSPLNLQLLPAQEKGGFLSLLEKTTPLLPTGALRAGFSADDSVSIGEQISDVLHSDKPSHASAVAESRSTDKVPERDVSEFLRATAVPASHVLTRIEEDVPRAAVVVDRGSSVVANSVCIDEVMSDVQLFEELSQALAVDESRFAEKVWNGDSIDSSEAAAVPSVPTETDEDDARAMAAVERSTLGMADSVFTDESILDARLSEEPSGTFSVDKLRSAENVLNRVVLDSSEPAAAVPESVVFTRIGKADQPAGLDSGSCLLAATTCGDDVISGVQLPEELSRDLTLEGSRSAEVVSERDVIDASGAAAIAVSLVPLRTEEEDSRVEVSVVGLMDNGEKISDVLVPDEPLHALALDRSRSAGKVLIESSVGAEDSASLVPIITGDDVPMSESAIEQELGHCGNAMVDTVQGKTYLRSFNPSDGQVLEKRIKSSSQCLETVKDGLDGQADLVHVGTTLYPAFLASHKEMGANGDSVGVPELIVRDAQIEYGMGSISETNKAVCSDDARVNLSVERELLLQMVVVDEPVDASVDEILRSEMVRDTGTVVEWFKQATFKQTDHRSFDVTKVVLEKESDISKGELVHSIHAEKAIDDLNTNASVEKSPSTSIPSNGYFARGEPHSTPEHLGSKSFCSEGITEPIDTGAVPGSSWQVGRKHTEDMNSMVGRDQEDNSYHVQALKDFLGENIGATVEHLMGRDYGSGPQRSCVGSVETTSTTVSPHDNEKLVDARCIYTDGRDHMVNLKEDKIEQDNMLGGPVGSSKFVGRSEVEQYKAHDLADEALEVQIVVSQYSKSRAVNTGLVVYRTGHKSQGFSSSELPLVEPGIRNQAERVPESHVGQIISGASDSGNSGDAAGQVRSTDPDAVSEVLRQAFLQDSDATISDSLESAQGTGAELVTGKEVQSPLVTKSKDRHGSHLDDSEGCHIRHLEDLGTPRTRHLEDLDENEEQPYASPFDGTLLDQLVGVQVRSFKKKGRPRAYNHEKVVRGTGRSHFHFPGSKRKNQLQSAGNRCRRNRHIYPDQPVPVFIEGRDEGFEEADGCSFLRWLAHQDEPIAAPSPALGKKLRKHGQELVKSIIAIPSFRVVSDYEIKQQEFEKRRKLGMQQQPISSSRPTFVSSNTVQPSEYNMDDEDERWLHAWNERLARGGLKQPISEDKFEEMIEYFERWSSEMDVSAAGEFPRFSHYGKSLAQPVPGGSLARNCPSGLGLFSTNPATSGTPFSGNSSWLNPLVQSGHLPWAGGLKDVMSPGRQGMVSSSILLGSIGKSSASAASTVCFHTLISDNERNISNSAVDAVCERPSEGSLGKPVEPFSLEKLSDDCCICNGGEDDENNPVYTCKRCLIHVHQSCYGIREKFRDDEGRVIAPLNWCCRKCEAIAVGRAHPNVSCALCRKRGGALKPTVVARKWAHVACALYTNETFFVDPDAMEPIDGIAAVAARAQERQERCGLCGVKRGICSLCAVKECRAPFHISCGVSQGASFELRQSKQKVVGVRSFCPRHARTTAMESVPSAELKDTHMLSSTSTSRATASATASGSISTASSMDDREEGSSRQSISHPHGSLGEPAGRAMNVSTRVVDLTDNVTSVNVKGIQGAGRGRPKGIRFTLKRRWDESFAQASEIGLSLDHQKRCGNGTGVSGRKVDASGCKSTWPVVEPERKLQNVKFKFGRLAQNLDLESCPTLFQQAGIGCENPKAEKMKDVVPIVGEVCGDAGVIKESELMKGLSEDRFVKEVKELMILEDAMKSGVAPGHIMREAFVYWRAKRAESKGSLIYELHHEQWLRSQGIFNKDASDEDPVATGKMGSPLSIPQAQQLSPMSTKKTLETAKEIRMQLARVRLMAQMVVQREELKYNHQLLIGSIASAELTRAEGVLEERHCIWCPSTKTLLKCGTCPRSFCFNCFKHRKGFGVKGWMAAMKQPMYICKYCRELSSELVDLSHNLDSVLKKIGEGGAVGTPGNTCGPAIEVVSSTPVISSEAVVGAVSTSVASSIHVGEGRGHGMGEGHGKGRSWHSPGFGLLRVAEDLVMATASKSVDVTEGREKDLRIGRGKRISWTAIDNGRRGSPGHGSEEGARNQSTPGQLENGLNEFLSSDHSQMEYSSFETTLRNLKILRYTNTDPHQEMVTSLAKIPPGDVATGPGMDGLEGVTPSTIIGGNVSVPSSPGSSPALLMYKKRRFILGASSESPPSAYYFGDQPCSPTWLMEHQSVGSRLPDG